MNTDHSIFHCIVLNFDSILHWDSVNIYLIGMLAHVHSLSLTVFQITDQSVGLSQLSVIEC